MLKALAFSWLRASRSASAVRPSFGNRVLSDTSQTPCYTEERKVDPPSQHSARVLLNSHCRGRTTGQEGQGTSTSLQVHPGGAREKQLPGAAAASTQVSSVWEDALPGEDTRRGAAYPAWGDERGGGGARGVDREVFLCAMDAGARACTGRI